jgi:hypothetical protein
MVLLHCAFQRRRSVYRIGRVRLANGARVGRRDGRAHRCRRELADQRMEPRAVEAVAGDLQCVIAPRSKPHVDRELTKMPHGLVVKAFSAAPARPRPRLVRSRDPRVGDPSIHFVTALNARCDAAWIRTLAAAIRSSRAKPRSVPGGPVRRDQDDIRAIQC